MDDLISRQAAMDFISAIPFVENHPHLGCFIKEWISQVPAVQPEQKTGRWENDKDCIPRCSCCSYIPEYNSHIDDYYYSDFCPNCGAKMESE